MSTRTKWIIDPSHSEIGFSVKHLMITKVKGQFKEFDASIYTTSSDFLTAEVDFWMNPQSIETGNADRDGHLRAADFFDTENHKEITFRGNTFERVNDDSYELHGDLTIKGITKRIKVDVEFGGVMKDPWGNEKAGFTLNAKINRSDWGISWNATLEAGGLLVSDEVRIACDVQLMKSNEETV
jgi:polyisoprenoid-binding protein YceI